MCLLSGMHRNSAVKELELCNTYSFWGREGGSFISDFLRNNSALTRRVVRSGTLGAQIARALQPGILGNQTLLQSSLRGYRLGDEGLSVIVDAIFEGNTTISELGLNNSMITAAGLRHMTRLQQQTAAVA